jgi:hypothetical protein
MHPRCTSNKHSRTWRGLRAVLLISTIATGVTACQDDPLAPQPERLFASVSDSSTSRLGQNGLSVSEGSCYWVREWNSWLCCPRARFASAAIDPDDPGTLEPPPCEREANPRPGYLIIVYPADPGRPPSGGPWEPPPPDSSPSPPQLPWLPTPPYQPPPGGPEWGTPPNPGGPPPTQCTQVRATPLTSGTIVGSLMLDPCDPNQPPGTQPPSTPPTWTPSHGGELPEMCTPTGRSDRKCLRPLEGIDRGRIRDAEQLLRDDAPAACRIGMQTFMETLSAGRVYRGVSGTPIVHWAQSYLAIDRNDPTRSTGPGYAHIEAAVLDSIQVGQRPLRDLALLMIHEGMHMATSGGYFLYPEGRSHSAPSTPPEGFDTYFADWPLNMTARNRIDCVR